MSKREYQDQQWQKDYCRGVLENMFDMFGTEKTVKEITILAKRLMKERTK